jgi:nucleotide-binding universal stress UspA family protein
MRSPMSSTTDMYDSIVVPIDGSDPAQAAAETAVRLANTFDAELSLLAVLEASDRSFAEPLPNDPGREELDTTWVRALDRASTAAADAGVPCRTAIESGTVHEEIEAHADRVDADLVAMGTHGRTGINRLLLGSVTERTLRALEIPVLTIPGADPVAADIEEILVPTNGLPGSEHAAAHACGLANAYDGTVHALGVVNVRSMTAAGGAGGVAIPNITQLLKERRERDVEAVREQADKYDLDFESRVTEGVPSQVICDYAEERDIDLITMGTHGREGVKRFFLGSVTERTVRESETPVLTTSLAE